MKHAMKHAVIHPLANPIPERFEILPHSAIMQVAAVMTKALKDHDEDGWRKLPARTHVGRAMRHMTHFLLTGSLEDLRHAACRALMALET